MSQDSARFVSSSSNEIKRLDHISSSFTLNKESLDNMTSPRKRSKLINQADVEDIIRLMNNEMSLNADLNGKESESEKCLSNDTGYDELNAKTTPSTSVDETNNNSGIKLSAEKENSDFYSQTTEKDSSSSSFKNEKFTNKEQQSDQIMNFAEKLTQDLISKETDYDRDAEDCQNDSEENYHKSIDAKESDNEEVQNNEYDVDEPEEVEEDEDEDNQNEEELDEFDNELNDFIQKAVEFGANALDISKKGLTRLPKNLFQLVDLQVLLLTIVINSS